MGLFRRKKENINILSPVNGNSVDLVEVPDQVFSEKMMGDGLAVDWTGGDVYAPIDGELVSLITPSCHAFGICHSSGLEVLVHVGLETVNLKGEGFNALKKQGDKVKAGEKILEVDYDLLKQKGLNLITPVIILNTSDFPIVERTTNYSVKSNETLFSVKQD